MSRLFIEINFSGDYLSELKNDAQMRAHWQAIGRLIWHQMLSIKNTHRENEVDNYGNMTMGFASDEIIACQYKVRPETTEFSDIGDDPVCKVPMYYKGTAAIVQEALHKDRTGVPFVQAAVFHKDTGEYTFHS